MLVRNGSLAVLGPRRDEDAFLEFISAIFSEDGVPLPISDCLHKYFSEFLVPSNPDTSPGLGFSFWDNDPTDRTGRLVATSGFHSCSPQYPRILRYGEGIVGHVLETMNDQTEFIPHVSNDYLSEPHLTARSVVTEDLGYRSGIAFPVCTQGQLIGVFKLYCGLSLDPQTASQRESLILEARRISVVFKIARARVLHFLGTSLADQFRKFQAEYGSLPRHEQLGALREALNACAQSALRVMNARGITIVHDGKPIVAVAHGDWHGEDLIADNLKQVFEGSSVGATARTVLEVSDKVDGTFFSRIDKAIFQRFAEVVEAYIDQYVLTTERLAQSEAAVRMRESLVQSAKEVTEQLVHAPSFDSTVEALMQGIHDSFGMTRLLFLRSEGGYLSAYESLPREIAVSLREADVKLAILTKCKRADKADWAWQEDCPTCGACGGLTAICGVRKHAIVAYDIGSLMGSPIFKDFGVHAEHECALPLMGEDRLAGVVDMYWSGNLPEVVLYFIDTICNVASLAIRSQQLVDQLRAITYQEARGEIARDIVHMISPAIAAFITEADLVHSRLRDIGENAAEKSAVRRGVSEATKKVEDLLDVARSNANILRSYRSDALREQEVEEDVWIEDVLADVQRIHSMRAEDKRVRWRTGSVGTRRTVWARRFDLYIVFWNLINNALKFTKGTKDTHISIKVAYRDSEVEVRIRDEGVGIQTRDEKRVWDLGFTRTAPGADRPGSGTGLHTVSKLINTSVRGGDVGFQSFGKRGTEFVVLIRQGVGQ